MYIYIYVITYRCVISVFVQSCSELITANTETDRQIDREAERQRDGEIETDTHVVGTISTSDA